MSALPQAIAPNPHTNLLNLYVKTANKMGFQQNKKNTKPCYWIMNQFYVLQLSVSHFPKIHLNIKLASSLLFSGFPTSHFFLSPSKTF
jgi:hypothetical protein